MYNESKAVLTLIALFFISEIALMVTTLILVIPTQTFTSDCLVASSPRIYIAYWCAIAFCLTMPQLISTLGSPRCASRRFCLRLRS